LDVEVNGNNIILLGDNSKGKSSFMQFIEIALGKQTNIPPNLISEGEVITMRNGKEYHFQVKIKDGKSKVVVTGPDGMKDDRKGTLSTLIGPIDFDVTNFVKLSDSKAGRKEQVEIYKSLLPSDVIEDLNRHQNKIRMDEEGRLECGQKVKALKGSLTSSPLYGSHLNVTQVDVSGVQKELEAASQKNTTIENAKGSYDMLCKTLDEKKAEFLELEQEIKTLQERADNGKIWLEKNEKVDTAALFEKINGAAEQNTKYNEAQRLVKQEKELKELEEEYGTYTALIQSSREAISNAIRDMDSPVKGLSFDEENLIYNGTPVSESSLATSEIIQLGCMMKMAQNPDFGILLIEHGESLGTERLKEIQDLAKANDWQIIMEQVERGTDELKIEIMGE